MGVRKVYSTKHLRSVWGYDAEIRGVRKRRFGFSTRAAAEVALANARVRENERAAGVIIEPPLTVTVRQVVEARVKTLPVAKGKPGYYSRNQAVGDLRRFLSLLGTDAAMPAQQLTTAHVAIYRDARLASGLAPQTVFRELTNIHACFNQAREQFPALDAWRPPARPKLKVPRGQREATFSPQDALRLLEYLRRPRGTEHERFKSGEPSRAYRSRLDAADYFQLALQSTKRGGELRSLRWADVLWHRAALRVDSTKVAEEGIVYLPASVMEMLERRRATQVPQAKWVFPSDIYPDRHVERGYTEIVRRAAIALGITWGYDKPGGVVFHTTRHTATTAMLEAGHDLATVQAQTGHSDKTMLKRYAHATTRSRRAAVTALDQFAPPPPDETRPQEVSGFSSTPGSHMSPMSRMSRTRAAPKSKKSRP